MKRKLKDKGVVIVDAILCYESSIVVGDNGLVTDAEAVQDEPEGEGS